MTIAGVRAGATLADVEKAWGPPLKRGADRLAYKDGPSVKVMTVGVASGLMIDVAPWAGPWVAAHADGPLSIWGKPCEEAAAALEFTRRIGRYTTCKHYERDSMIDVTLMCTEGAVSSVAVVWMRFDPLPANKPLPPDECSGS
jgi:hypothetical protein